MTENEVVTLIFLYLSYLGAMLFVAYKVEVLSLLKDWWNDK